MFQCGCMERLALLSPATAIAAGLQQHAMKTRPVISTKESASTRFWLMAGVNPAERKPKEFRRHDVDIARVALALFRTSLPIGDVDGQIALVARK